MPKVSSVFAHSVMSLTNSFLLKKMSLTSLCSG